MVSFNEYKWLDAQTHTHTHVYIYIDLGQGVSVRVGVVVGSLCFSGSRIYSTMGVSGGRGNHSSMCGVQWIVWDQVF